MSQSHLKSSEYTQNFLQYEEPSVREDFNVDSAILIRKFIFLILVCLNAFLVYSANTKRITPNYLGSNFSSKHVIVGDIAVTDEIDAHGESENIFMAALDKAANDTFTFVQTSWSKIYVYLSGNFSPSVDPSNLDSSKKSGIDQVLTLAEFYQEIIRDSKISHKVNSKQKNKPRNIVESAIDIMNSKPLGPPVNGLITSSFGRRSSPFTSRVSFHSGIDISIPEGAPVVSSADGIVKFSGRKGGYGKMVQIEHLRGHETWYAHLSKVDVLPGRVIKRGQKIGAVGSTGQSTGPHLHYEIRKNGVPIDPKPFMDLGVKLAKK